MDDYGRELILDLHGCDPATFKRSVIKKFMIECCKIMEVKRCDLHFWDDYGVPKAKQQTNPKTKGTSAIQFLLESNITIHTLDLLGKVFLNFFFCKEFDPRKMNALAEETFKGKIVNRHIVRRI